ncbi:hypothetical protein ACOSQ3_021714 [Xanthoceras sorbifolium]
MALVMNTARLDRNWSSKSVEDPYKGIVRHSLHVLIRILAMIMLIMSAVFPREFVNIYCKDLPKYGIHFPRFPDILQNEESDSSSLFLIGAEIAESYTNQIIGVCFYS